MTTDSADQLATCPECGSGEWDYNEDGLAEDSAGHTWGQAPAEPGIWLRPGRPGDVNDPERFPGEDG